MGKLTVVAPPIFGHRRLPDGNAERRGLQVYDEAQKVIWQLKIS
jgi:hypothetical protein